MEFKLATFEEPLRETFQQLLSTLAIQVELPLSSVTEAEFVSHLEREIKIIKTLIPEETGIRWFSLYCLGILGLLPAGPDLARMGIIKPSQEQRQKFLQTIDDTWEPVVNQVITGVLQQTGECYQNDDQITWTPEHQSTVPKLQLATFYLLDKVESDFAN